MKTMFEKRLAETKEKFSKLNSVYVSERSSTFHLPEANYLNVSRCYLFSYLFLDCSREGTIGCGCNGTTIKSFGKEEL